MLNVRLTSSSPEVYGYQELQPPQPVQILHGVSLAHRDLDPQDRAGYGARLVYRRAILIPSIQNVCDVLRVSRPLVTEAMANGDGQDATYSFAVGLMLAGWQMANAAERKAAVATIGVGDVWDFIAEILD